MIFLMLFVALGRSDSHLAAFAEISPETKHVLEIVKLLHSKKKMEETKDSLDNLDKTISDLRDKIRVLTEQKHDLGALSCSCWLFLVFCFD